MHMVNIRKIATVAEDAWKTLFNSVLVLMMPMSPSYPSLDRLD